MTIAPDDPRHGTTRGYHAGCKDACCRRAMARYEKAGRLARLNGGRAVPALGAKRRLQALMRLGWTSSDIAAACGWPHRNHVFRIINGQKGKPTSWLQRGTDQTVRDVFERMSMQIPEETVYRRRTRKYAESQGYAPPLAWDNIDDPRERPKFGNKPKRHDDFDEAVVMRLLEGHRIPSNKAEKNEALRRWKRDGKSERSLCLMHGWRDGGRYDREDAA